MKDISYYALSLLLALFISGCKTDKKQPEPEKKPAVSWSEQNMSEFQSNCIGILEKEGVSDAKSYCDCLLESSMESYPDAELAMELEQHQIVKLFEESKCLDDILMIKLEDPWNEEVEELFLKHCAEAQAKLERSEDEANAYCACALEEIKTIVPNPHHVMALTEEELEQVLEKCNP